MPLRVFEERYLRLVNDLLSLPAEQPRTFGVLGIELGHEVGEQAAHQLSQVGCVAEISSVRRRPDESFDLLVMGVERFRVTELIEPDVDTPYLSAWTTPLPDAVGDEAEHWGERVARRFALYCERLNGIGVPAELPEDFPDAPLPRSYSVAGAMILDQRDKQALLEAEHAAARLEMAASLLRRENRILSGLRLLPAGRFLNHEVNLN